MLEVEVATRNKYLLENNVVDMFAGEYGKILVVFVIDEVVGHIRSRPSLGIDPPK